MLGRSQGESEKTKNIQKSWKNSNRCSAKVTTVAISRSDLRHRWRLPPASAFWPRVPLQLSGMELIFPYQHMDIEKKVVVWKKNILGFRVSIVHTKTIQKRNRRNSTGYSCAPFDVGFLYRSSIESTVNNLHRIVEHLIEQRIQIIAAGTSPADFFTYLI